MKSLRTKIRDDECEKCNLSDTRDVCLIGTGPAPAEVMIIGEHPGKKGRSIIEETLNRYDIDIDEVFITYAVKCIPPDGRSPTNKEMEACSYWLNKEMKAVKPQKIVVLGSIATKAFYRKYNTSLKSNMGKRIEVEKSWGNVAVTFTYAPGAILRKPFLKGDFIKPWDNFFKEKKRTGTLASRWSIGRFLRNYHSQAVIDIEWGKGEDGKFHKWYDPEAEITSIAISPAKGIGYWIENDSDWSEVMTFLNRSDCLIIGHSLKGDLKWLIHHGYLSKDILYQDRIFDTLIGMNVLDENCMDKGLKSLAYNNTSITEWEKPDFDNVTPEELRVYNCKDVDGNKRLYNWEKKQYKLPENEELDTPLLIDQRVIAVLTLIELKGMKVDIPAIKEMDEKLTVKLREIALYTKVLNPNSADQKAAKLMRMGFKLILTVKSKKSKEAWAKLSLKQRAREKKPPKMSWCTDKETLKDLLTKCKKGGKKERVINSMLEYGKYKKLHSTFVVGLLNRLSPTGTIHPTYNAAKREDFEGGDEDGGTVTGRLSCKDPNFQQLPRDKEDLEKEFSPRRAIIPCGKGRSIISADFAQIEMVLAGIYHGEDRLVDMYVSGEDIHTLTASDVLGIPARNITVDQRKAAKAVNFGILYGQTKYGLATRLGWDIGQAASFIRKYFKAFPDLEEGIYELEEFVIANGYVENYFGRRRRLPGANRKTGVGREMLRQGINAPIQGTAGDLTKLCMWELFLASKEMNSWMIGQVHDETVWDADNRDKEEMKYIIEKTYSKPDFSEYGVEDFPITLRGDIEIGPNWLTITEKYSF